MVSEGRHHHFLLGIEGLDGCDELVLIAKCDVMGFSAPIPFPPESTAIIFTISNASTTRPVVVCFNIKTRSDQNRRPGPRFG